MMNMPSGSDALPKKIDEQLYRELLEAFRAEGKEELLQQAYPWSKTDGCYLLHLPESMDARAELLRIYNRTKCRCDAPIWIVAYYIYAHRLRFGRKGDPIDDYNKAAYLIYLADYFSHLTPPRVIHLRQDAEMEELIDEVNNIFDSAYFRKINHPELSDVQCFFDAEREFCEEKDIEYIRFQQQRADRTEAEKAHVEQEIRALAHRHYLWREANHQPGGAESDWAVAEKEYPKWKMTKRIATICWNLSSDQRRHQDHYWLRACEVVEKLEARGIAYAGANPYATPGIYDTIAEALAAHGEQAVSP